MSGVNIDKVFNSVFSDDAETSTESNSGPKDSRETDKPEHSKEKLTTEEDASTPKDNLAITLNYTDDGGGYEGVRIPIPKVKHWVSISYHELTSRISETFHGPEEGNVFIDGFTEPSTNTNRFSLGVLNNINRSSLTYNVRKFVGRGIELQHENAVVKVFNHSDYPIFVQSPNCNQMYNWDLGTVVKVASQCSLPVFNTNAFANTLSQGICKGFEEVYSLARFCSIRISFVKGWGLEYRRQSIMNTPCWIEVRLNSPLKWIDFVLTEIEGPEAALAGSIS